MVSARVQVWAADLSYAMRVTWTSHEPEKARPPVECAIRLRGYRGVGRWYVREAALALSSPPWTCPTM
ncbi:hypothetical protein GCM10011428_10430 [Streptomyces violaceus]